MSAKANGHNLNSVKISSIRIYVIPTLSPRDLTSSRRSWNVLLNVVFDNLLYSS